MTAADKTEWNKTKADARKDFKKDFEEAKKTRGDKRKKEKGKKLKSMKDRRKNFVKQQAKCFRRLFKVTTGMMCMTCNANYTRFLAVDAVTGSYKLRLNNKVCKNLQKDCYPYLNATNRMGRNILDMKKLKKMEKEKAKLTDRMTKL